MFSDISGLKASEDDLIASESPIRTILESITDGFYVLDRDWRFSYINAAGERILSRMPGDLIGKCVWEEFPGTVGSEFERVYRRVATVGVGEFFTAYYPNFDRWYELTANPAPEGLTVYFRDVTDQKLSDQRLRASEDKRRLALDAAELGTWHMDPAINAIQTDARFRAIFGTDDGCTEYAQLLAVIHPDDLSAVQEAAAATRAEQPVPYAIEYRVVHADGSQHWVMANGRMSIADTGPTTPVSSFDGTVADVTERKRGQEERERLVARLQEQDQRKDEFLATLAHELRNPLAHFCNGLQIMRMAQGDAEATERVRAMMERIGMPKLNGYEVGRRLRQQTWGKEIVLVAVTGWGQEEDKRRSLEAGFDFHLTKPVIPAAVEKLLAGIPVREA